MKFHILSLLVTFTAVAHAEQYVIATDFHPSQPATFRVALNGQTLLLHRAADGNVDITPWVKAGQNTLTVNVDPGKNENRFSKSTLTLGAGQNGQWRTLFKKDSDVYTKAGTSTFTFIGKPSGAGKLGKVSLFGKFHPSQPAQFDVALNGESVSTLSSDGNFDLTPFLKPGKNVVVVKYTASQTKNQFSQSTLTIGQQVGSKWVSLLKWGVGHWDTKAGSVTFPIYR
ncbi:hypothetical protein K7W42_22580 [Deinococcus sp. HMF7604]|uniref:hypothetical protein n=1 Tax=Deinococcus betulae TaxID=2873312 RepID=UPI001CCD3CE4|nr:hypothetical protein [Deinococcus betulae]MBZ9753613.1 hypothetical protein [Deinococcus betulae]